MQLHPSLAGDGPDSACTSSPSQTPRVIIHGGAGNFSRANLPPPLYDAHRRALTGILRSTHAKLRGEDDKGGADALDAAVHAVTLLERDPLFNAGRGAVFARDGSIELEASVMVSRGYRKRGAAVSLIRHVKSPIGLAAEMLRRGEQQGGGGAQRHEQISGMAAEDLAGKWGLELVDRDYFWTRKRWEEHCRGLERERRSDEKRELYDFSVSVVGEQLRPDGSPWSDNEPGWDGLEYLPQGTVGCVVMDRHGVLAVATSTGGLTNKLPGRLGDTPTFGAGFWAEEWDHQPHVTLQTMPALSSLFSTVAECVPIFGRGNTSTGRHSVAMSGTGNGDSFLRIAAVHSAAAKTRYGANKTLQEAVQVVAGRGGELQRSAGEWWSKDFEGQGGIIGIENRDGRTSIVFDFNCGGMFRCWIDDHGKEHCMVFHEPY